MRLQSGPMPVFSVNSSLIIFDLLRAPVPYHAPYLLFEPGLGSFVVSWVRDHASQVKPVEPQIGARSLRYGGGEGVPEVLAVTVALAVRSLFGVCDERRP